jgi:DNA-binding GntR family transcriptional regulator
MDVHDDRFVSTVAAKTARALRDAIMQGHLAPGQKLVEAQLVAALDISRPSLREALRTLQAERLVELIPNRGPFVAKLGPDEVEQIHEVWALLTGEAVVHFVAVAGASDLNNVSRALAKIRHTIPNGTVLRRIEAINRFFSLILLKTGNAILADMVGSLVCRINFLRARSLSERTQAARYVKEIAAIVRHIRNKDARGARAATQKHIESVCSAALLIPTPPPLDPEEFTRLLRTSSQQAGTDWFSSTKIGRNSGSSDYTGSSPLKDRLPSRQRPAGDRPANARGRP